MVRKTIIREAFSAKHLPRDPKKVDDSYQYMKMREARYAEIEAQAEITANANATLIDTTPAPAALPEGTTVDTGSGEVIETGTAAPVTSGGPDF